MLNRYRVGCKEIKLQEVGGVYVAKAYLTLSEMSDFVKQRLSEDDKRKFEESVFVPIKMDVKDEDLTIEFTFAASHAK